MHTTQTDIQAYSLFTRDVISPCFRVHYRGDSSGSGCPISDILTVFSSPVPSAYGLPMVTQMVGNPLSAAGRPTFFFFLLFSPCLLSLSGGYICHLLPFLLAPPLFPRVFIFRYLSSWTFLLFWSSARKAFSPQLVHRGRPFLGRSSSFHRLFRRGQRFRRFRFGLCYFFFYF